MNSGSTPGTLYELQANTSTFCIRKSNVLTLSSSLMLAPTWKYLSSSGNIFTLINSSAQLAPFPSWGPCNCYKRASSGGSVRFTCSFFQLTMATKHCLVAYWLPLTIATPFSVHNLTFTCRVDGTAPIK